MPELTEDDMPRVEVIYHYTTPIPKIKSTFLYRDGGLIGGKGSSFLDKNQYDK